MSTTVCPGCGAPATPGAGFCAYCGTALPAGGGPLASGIAPPLAAPPPPPPAPQFEGVSTARRPRSRLFLIVVVVIVVVVVVAAAIFIFTYRSSPVQVGAINLWAPDNVCGLKTAGVYYNGFNSSTSANQTFLLGVPNYNASACNIRGISTNTTGFTIYPHGLPLLIPGHSTVNLNLTVRSPTSDFSGDLNLVLR